MYLCSQVSHMEPHHRMAVFQSIENFIKLVEVFLR